MTYSRRNASKVILYIEPSVKTIDLDEIETYIKEKLCKTKVSIEGDFFHTFFKKTEFDWAAEKLAQLRVREPTRIPDFAEKPMYGEIQYEKELLENPKDKPPGIVYDGLKLHAFFREVLLKNKEDLSKHIHVIITSRLFGTFDEKDRRYHARVIVCGVPSIISTTGIVESPAKPKEFYRLREKYAQLGARDVAVDVLKEKFKGSFIDYNDERMTDVVKGYIMQALFYHLTFEPFCTNKNCRLYNAHWQEEMINAQITVGKFCKKHEKILKEIRERSSR
ncbi:MAG: DUF6775 family putative metallopeptidase [Thermoplasmata archaeon]